MGKLFHEWWKNNKYWAGDTYTNEHLAEVAWNASWDACKAEAIKLFRADATDEEFEWIERILKDL